MTEYITATSRQASASTTYRILRSEGNRLLHAAGSGSTWFDIEDGTLFPGPHIGIAEDVLVDDRGYIYVDTYQDGLYIVRCTV